MATPRSQSPQYPQYPLPECIVAIQSVFEAKGRQPVTTDVLISLLGYTSASGSAKGKIAALRHYGLVERAGDGLCLTDDAITILTSADKAPEQMKYLKRCLYRPKIFAEFKSSFGERVPEKLPQFLINRHFSPRAAKLATNVYQKGLLAISEDHGDKRLATNRARSAATRSDVSNSGQDHVEHSGTQVPLAGAVPADDALRFRIGPSAEAQITFKGAVTQDSVKKLITFLELSIDTFPTALY